MAFSQFANGEEPTLITFSLDNQKSCAPNTSMPAHLTMINPFVSVTVLICVAVFVMRLLWKHLPDDAGLKPVAAFLQIVLLAVVSTLLFSSLSGAAVGLDWRALGGNDLSSLKLSIAWGVFISALLIVPLLIGYLVRNSATAILLSLLWVIGFGFAIYAWGAFPTVNAIRDADAAGLYDDSLLLSVWFIPLRLWAWSTVTLVYGICFVRHRFSMPRLLISTVIAGFVIGLICAPKSIPVQLWPGPFALAAIACLLATFPFSRQVMAHHLGVKIPPGQQETSSRKSSSTRILAGICACLLITFVGFSVVVNYHENVQAETVMNGRVYNNGRTDGINAYDALKTRFLKVTSPSIATAGVPKDYTTLLQLIDSKSSASSAQIIAEMDHTDWDGYLGRIQPYVHDLTSASMADYLIMPAGKMVSYLNLRETARALSIRSQLAWHDGHGKDAINDLNVILNMARLMRDQPTLVGQMMGNALKNLGTQTARNLLADADNKPDMLQQLDTALNNAALQMERGLNYDALKVGEAGILSGTIIPNVEIVVPAIGRAHRDVLDSCTNFQKTRIAVTEASGNRNS